MRFLTTLLSLVFYSGCLTFAQQPSERSTTLPTVVVSGSPPTNDLRITPKEDTSRVNRDLMSDGATSISSLTIGEMDQKVIATPIELFSRAPNALGGAGGSRSFGNIFGVRGIGNSLQYSASSVTLYLDGVPLIRARQFPADLVNPSSAKVYRGPQVTEFGFAGEAGVFSIETTAPSENWSGLAEGSYGSYDDQRYFALTSGSLAPGLLGQVGGFYSRGDGVVFNPVSNSNIDSTKSFGGSAKILWQPSENSELALLFWRQEGRKDSPRIVPLSSDPFTYPTDINGRSDDSNTIGALRYRRSEENWEMSAVVSGQWWKLDPFRFDADFTPVRAAVINIPMDEEVWLGEITANSTTDVWTEFTWRVGVSGALDAWHFSNDRKVPAAGFTDSSTQSVETQSASFYGMIGLPLTDKFRAWAGARFTWNWEQARQSYFGPLAPNVTLRDSKSSMMALPDAGIEFQVDDTMFLYAKCAGGGKPGGFTPFLAATQLSKYKPEYLINAGSGLKKSWLSNKITLQTSAFYYSIDNYQFESVLSSGNYSIFNVPRASGVGGEIECIASPIDSLEIGLGFGLTKTTIEAGSDPATGRSVVGKRLPYAPLFTASGSIAWRPLEGWLLFVEGLVVGDSYANLANNARFRQDTYGILDFKVGYEWEHAGIYFVANNVTDTQYYSLILPNLGAAGAGSPGDPQSFGVQVACRF